jgi:hypothetical protein
MVIAADKTSAMRSACEVRDEASYYPTDTPRRTAADVSGFQQTKKNRYY